MLEISIAIISFLIVPSLQQSREACHLGLEKCSCSFSSSTDIIQVDCSSRTMRVINLLDLDKDLNVSNDGQLGIDIKK